MKLLFLLGLVATGLCPFLYDSQSLSEVPREIPQWPARFEGRPLRALGLGPREREFMASVPGCAERFTDGAATIVIRWVPEVTRNLHLASLCYRGGGWSIDPLPVYRDPSGRQWGQYIATKNGERLRVRQRIEDAMGHSWIEESSWYWNASFRDTLGPYWAWTVAIRE